VANPSGPYTAVPANSYAHWGQRFIAYLIDVAPPVIVLVILVRISVALAVIGWLLAIGWMTYNRWYVGGTTGQSVGKKVLNIWLLGEETGQPIGMLRAFLRDICHLVDSVACFVGFLFPLWDAKRQTLADMIVKSVVIPG
jgi:uncharacterized RDD family membrane protein YckC